MATNVDQKRLGIMNERFSTIAHQEKCVDVITLFIDELQKACGFTKLTFYALNPLAQQTVKKGVNKDKQRNLHTIAFEDKVTTGSVKYIGVCSANQLCQKIVYDSV